MNIKDILNLEIGKKQKVGVMSVYPLLGKDLTTNLANFEDIKFLGTVGYGNMQFRNDSEKAFIVPSGYSIITEQSAQDHAIPFASLIDAYTTSVLDLACCIQQHQGGYIEDKNIKDFYLLPVNVRKAHLESIVYQKPTESKITLSEGYNLNFTRLWPIISNFQRELVKNDEAHLVYFFTKFMDKLNEFNAEFEVVKNQIGAVIMINDKIVGIEIAPTHEYWKVLWKKLIRDCYGSEIIRLTYLNLIEEFQLSRKLELNLEGCNSIKDIRKVIKTQDSKDKKNLKHLLEQFTDKELLVAETERSRSFKNYSNETMHYDIFKIKDEKVYGEVYTENNTIVYLSVLF